MRDFLLPGGGAQVACHETPCLIMEVQQEHCCAHGKVSREMLLRKDALLSKGDASECRYCML